MNLSKRSLILALTWLSAGMAVAQDTFPSRPITIVVPYPAGGTSDIQVRMFQEPLARALGVPVVVDNKPGASGAVASQFVANAKGDGYTLMYPNNGFLIAPLLAKKATYDPIKDFKPISLVTSVPMVLVTNKNVPATNLADFLALAKKQPDGLLYASAGTASYGHLATTRLAQMAGIKLTHVPYKGEANTTMAVRSGEVQMLLTTPSSAMLSQVKEGNLKMLAVATEAPSALAPGVPTIDKTVPGFTAAVWFGLVAPAATPDAVVQKINAAVRKVIADEAIGAKLLPTGAQPQTSTPAEFASMMAREHSQWRDIVTKYKIEAD
jgi:tripartite-type tricarboxylate transporter receptor subunit TctC